MPSRLDDTEVADRLKTRPYVVPLTQYCGMNKNIWWRCARCNHEWHAAPSSVLWRGSGCPQCSRQRRGAKRRASAAVAVFSRLSNRPLVPIAPYISAKTLIPWRCLSCEHSWLATPDNISRGRGCPQCKFSRAADRMRLTHDEVVLRLRDRSVIPLDTYRDSATRMSWRCLVCNCEWCTTANSILKGSGCPTCANGASEHECRRILESLTGVKFPSANPKWLNGLRFDGYSRQLRIAFEYDGYQHCVFPNYFHKTRAEWIAQRRRDRKKDALCCAHHVTLIRIPHTVKNRRLFIVSALTSLFLNMKE